MFKKNVLLKFKNNLALITDSGEEITYGKLIEFSDTFFNQIGSRCLIFHLCNNSVESLIGYVSCIQNRVVPLLLDASLDKQLLVKLIQRYRPEYIWVPIEKIKDFNDFEQVFQWRDYALLQLNFEESYKLNDNLALLFTTSGSTGSPKLVRISYENLKENAKSISEYLSITSEERPITALPMYYSFGLSIINSHLIEGATILLTDKSLMEKGFWDFVKSEKATSLSGVPYTFEILKKFRFFKMELPHLKTLTQAGGKLDIKLSKEFAEYCLNHGKHFFVMYGQTEATARMSYLPLKWMVSKAGGIGTPIPGGEFFLVDEKKDRIMNEDTVGELVYEGKNVCLGYANCGSDLIKGDENEGRLFTGDLAKRDSEGCYYIVGRMKRFIKLYGNRVNLDESEQLLKSLIKESACVGRDDKMIIYIADKNLVDKTKKFISNKMGINLNAFEVRFIEEIPKNPAGKTLYSELSLNE